MNDWGKFCFSLVTDKCYDFFDVRGKAIAKRQLVPKWNSFAKRPTYRQPKGQTNVEWFQSY